MDPQKEELKKLQELHRVQAQEIREKVKLEKKRRSMAYQIGTYVLKVHPELIDVPVEKIEVQLIKSTAES